MKRAYLKDEAFLADVASLRGDQTRLHVWWLGQSGFLVQWREKHVLFDPYLSDSLTKKYDSTDKPHVRMTERVVAPERLDFVQVVTSSHNHTDHLDAGTLYAVYMANRDVKFVIPEANRAFVSERLGCDSAWPIGVDAGSSVDAAGIRITGVPAAHNSVDRDSAGRCLYLGYVAQLGPWTIYHSGDTLRYDGMAELLQPFGVDVALLPINGDEPERRVAGNLDGREAAQLAKDIGAKLVVPCHYDMFEFNTADPVEFVRACEALGQPYCVLEQGQRWSSGGLAN